jgi:predicted AlkP superfamily pyrophosphatase or phosphodiesterase
MLSTNRHLALALALTFAVAALPPLPLEAQAPRARHVVLVSIDGLRPEFYLDGGWPAPMLQRMAREGAHARAVRSVFPAVTLAAHATIVTGAVPGRHGIVDNRPFEPGGPSGRWYGDDALALPTLWHAVRTAGLTSANVAWPLSGRAPVDHDLPGVWPQDALALPTQRRTARPPGLLEELEREATGRLHDERFRYGVLARDDQAGAMAAYLLERHRPALLTVHLVGTDWWQHAEGRDGPGVRRAVAAADRAIARIVEAAEQAGILDRTAFVITGDHGLSDMHVRLAPNAWLVEVGLHEARRDRGEWRAAFHSSGGTIFLYLRDPDDHDAIARARAAVEARPAGERRLFRVLEREEIVRRGGDPRAALALAAEVGVVFNESPTLPSLTPVIGGTHGYVPEEPEMLTGLVLWGAGARSGAVASRPALEDVAPLVASLLGIPFAAPDGVLPAGMLADP